jgi:integrase/recombinase XerD
VKYVVNDQIVLMRPPEGPLAAFIRPFSDWAREQGYALDSLRQRIRIAIGFNQEDAAEAAARSSG